MHKQSDAKLYIALVGLPAMGKSVVSAKIKENLEKEGVEVRVFNNGDVRRRLFPQNTSHAEFYDPANRRHAAIRDDIALVNIYAAKGYLNEGAGQVAILDATNVSRDRRSKIEAHLADHPILFVECVNEDKDLYAASVARKAKLPEFANLSAEAARQSFEDRINYYRKVYVPLGDEDNFVIIDSLDNRVLRERFSQPIPLYPRIRDLLVSDWVKSLYLARHGETVFNLEDRMGGDSALTDRGLAQSEALAGHFRDLPLPYVITSTRRRSLQMARPLVENRTDRTLIALKEFDEIHCGECENWTYEDFRRDMPDGFKARAADKYNYAFPGGESYASIRERVGRGLKKALYLSGPSENVLIIGHQAVNRMILSHFLFRRTEDVPHIFIPQDKYFHIVSTQSRKVLELRPY